VNNWFAWTIIWWALYGITTVITLLFLESYYWITLFSVIILAIYELVFIPYYLKKKETGLRALICKQIDEFKPAEAEYERVMTKISASISTNAALAGVSFTLLVFSLGFLYLANIEITLDIKTFLVFGMLIPLLLSGICYLIVLDQYDTAAEPSINVETKWKMRKLALNFFVAGWQFLVFGILIGLSLLHPLLTLVGCIFYTLIHNIFWFQSLQ